MGIISVEGEASGSSFNASTPDTKDSNGALHLELLTGRPFHHGSLRPEEQFIELDINRPQDYHHFYSHQIMKGILVRK